MTPKGWGIDILRNHQGKLKGVICDVHIYMLCDYLIVLYTLIIKQWYATIIFNKQLSLYNLPYLNEMLKRKGKIY